MNDADSCVSATKMFSLMQSCKRGGGGGELFDTGIRTTPQRVIMNIAYACTEELVVTCIFDYLTCLRDKRTIKGFIKISKICQQIL